MGARLPLVLAMLAVVSLGGQAEAQTAPPEKPESGSPSAGPASPSEKVAVPRAAMPDATKILILVRSTLLTLGDALRTGNFTVLRDVGAPGFRDANSASKLSRIFADLAQRRVDLLPVAVVTPQLAGPPELDEAKGMLRLKGHFPTRPQQIDFLLIYQAVAGQWALFGLSVNTSGPSEPSPTAKSAGDPANEKKAQ